MGLRRERERIIAGSVVLGGPHPGMEVFGENGEKLFDGDYSDCFCFGLVDVLAPGATGPCIRRIALGQLRRIE